MPGSMCLPSSLAVSHDGTLFETFRARDGAFRGALSKVAVGWVRVGDDVSTRKLKLADPTVIDNKLSLNDQRPRPEHSPPPTSFDIFHKNAQHGNRNL
jgi:hypothetical protein